MLHDIALTLAHRLAISIGCAPQSREQARGDATGDAYAPLQEAPVEEAQGGQ